MKHQLAEVTRTYHGIQSCTSERDEKILEMAPMVKRIALSLYHNVSQFVQLDDLISAGTIGLIESVSRFDPSYGVPLQAYCARRVRGAIQDELRRLDPMSRTQRSRVNKKEALIETLTRQLGREPTAEELADEAGLSMEEWQDFNLEAEKVIIVKENPENSMTALVEMLPDKKSEENGGLLGSLKEEEKEQLTQALRKLPEKLYMIISLYYYSDFNYKEIGQVLGVSESRVCQLHSKAILTIRRELENIKS